MALTAIVIDSREPTWVQQLTFGGIPTCVTLLESGDVLASADDGSLLAIERKNADDLLGSVKDGRLLEQCARLRKVSQWAYLVIVGTLQRGQDGNAVTDRGQTGWSYAAIQAALLTVQELGVFIIQTTDVQFEATVLGLGKRNRSEAIQQKPVRPFNVLSPAETILASLPGIGIERVTALLAYTGSPAQALAYLTDMDLNGHEHVPGIGPYTKASVRLALGIPDGQELILAYTQDKQGVNADGQ